MGTSSSGGGAGGSNPLIPNWIPGGDMPLPQPPPDPINPSNDNNNDNNGNDDTNGNEGQPGNGNNPADTSNNQPINDIETGVAGVGNGRYRQPRINFNKYTRSGGKDVQALKQALKGYSKNAAGGTKRLARRMKPSISRVTGFYDVINTVRQKGKVSALVQFNLATYQNRPLFETLSALSDEIFKDTGKPYEDTQDDSITKQAYANTVVRICELEGIDLDNLTNEQVEVMMAIFIEETIAQRVICDIGNNFTKVETDIKELIEIENNIYQIVSGLVRNKIMPEIIVTQRGDKQDLEKNIENIYRMAFDAMAGIND
jgi:hypothetical protein